jgi:trigger factor
MKTDIKKLDNSEIEIDIEIPADDFMAYWDKAVKRVASGVKIDGFRPGKAPTKMVVEKVGEDKILIDMAEEALQERYFKIFSENKLDVIGQPEVSITKIAKDNPLGLKVKTAVMPEVKMPDYKKIAKEVAGDHPTEADVTAEEVDKVVDEIRKNKAEQDQSQKAGAEADAEGKPAEKAEKKEPELPEVTDDFVKTLGDFKSVADFRAKINDNVTAEKKHRSIEKRRIAIIEKIGEVADPSLPPILITYETDKMLNEMRGQVEQMGMKFEDYLTHLKKSAEDLKKDWEVDAKKRVMFGLMIHKIAELEKIAPTDEAISEQAKILKTKMPDGDKMEESRIKAYVRNVLTNEQVMEFLDPIKTEK